MNYNNYIFLDFETGGKFKHISQPIQLAAVGIDGRKLTYGLQDTFETLMRPVFDEQECVAKNIEPLQEQALKVNKKTIDELESAPSPQVAWDNFVAFVQRYKTGNGKWDNPILVGFNNDNFDNTFVDRLCAEYGPCDKETKEQQLFHPVTVLDLRDILFQWTEDLTDWKRLSMDALREKMGMDDDSQHLLEFKAQGRELYAHDALRDVVDGAAVFVKFMKLHRKFAHKVGFNNAFKRNKK